MRRPQLGERSIHVAGAGGAFQRAGIVGGGQILVPARAQLLALRAPSVEVDRVADKGLAETDIERGERCGIERAGPCVGLFDTLGERVVAVVRDDQALAVGP